jgi:hypothetical protein
MRRLRVLTIVTGSMFLSLLLGCASPSGPVPPTPPAGADWMFDFDLSPDDLTTTGRNPFFILEPGFQLILEGGGEKLTITVLNETETVGEFTTRVVEEREEKRGELREVSRNYFARSKATGDVFYFGEVVDMYQNGEVVRHEGAWRADKDDARPGLIMPGRPVIGMRYYQEVAPGKALDRAEVVSLDETLRTPAGVFGDCLKTQETTPLNPMENEYKTYAPDIGLIQDERLLLTQHGFVELED